MKSGKLSVGIPYITAKMGGSIMMRMRINLENFAWAEFNTTGSPLYPGLCLFFNGACAKQAGNLYVKSEISKSRTLPSPVAGPLLFRLSSARCAYGYEGVAASLARARRSAWKNTYQQLTGRVAAGMATSLPSCCLCSAVLSVANRRLAS